MDDPASGLGYNSSVIATSITIDAPPSKVRDIILRLQADKSWPNKFIYNLNFFRGEELLENGLHAQAGDSIEVIGPAGSARAEILVNNGSMLRYQGTAMGTTCTHTIEFADANCAGDGRKTLVKHGETYSAGISFLFARFSPMRAFWLEPMFHDMNRALKKCAETNEQQS